MDGYGRYKPTGGCSHGSKDGTAETFTCLDMLRLPPGQLGGGLVVVPQAQQDSGHTYGQLGGRWRQGFSPSPIVSRPIPQEECT
jgi:hypothetical protein